MTTVDQVHFATPESGSWGSVTHAVIPNPGWRWWAFWRARSVVLELPTAKAIQTASAAGRPIDQLEVSIR